jgi:hypothetical protein
MEFNKDQKAVLSTLLYSDIFDFPLTLEELYINLISPSCHSREVGNPNTLQKTLKTLSSIVSEKKGFYCMTGKENSIENRINRLKYAKKKLKIAQKISTLLSHIPSIYFIGITGRLAHNDADENDDIDMFFITKKNTIWTTRALILVILQLMNLRRKPNETNPANKICANLIIEETALHWPNEKHDIYTAHEIINMQPLFSKNNMYKKFLSSNNWITQFYPNHNSHASHNVIPSLNVISNLKSYAIINTIKLLIIPPLTELILKKLQLTYMKKKITNETILPDFLAFHPHDYRQEVLKNFTKKLKQYGLPD